MHVILYNSPVIVKMPAVGDSYSASNFAREQQPIRKLQFF